MTRLRTTLLLLLLLSWLTGTQEAQPAHTVQIHNGMGTGQDYLQMPEPERPAYVMGLVNGLFLSPLFGASRQSGAPSGSRVLGLCHSSASTDDPGQTTG